VPVQTVFRDQEKSWVYLKNSKTNLFEERYIQTDICSISQCVIQSGLKAGDIIALTNPTETMEPEQ
jgi:hypothetical protein